MHNIVSRYIDYGSITFSYQVVVAIKMQLKFLF